MSTNNHKNNEEEVDLGSLFVVIGNGFSKLFNFIGNIFKGIFQFLIATLLFLKSNYIKIGIGALIGASIGFFLDLKSEQKYEAMMHVEPNFNSARQLYNNVGFYNDLVKQKDTFLLAQTFQISITDAASLRKFEITPVVDEKDILNAYDHLIKSVDTTTIKGYSFSKFKNTLSNFDYKIHKIYVIATQNDVFSKLDETIITTITENEYFNKLKKINQENFNRTDKLLRKNLMQADSLYHLYKKVMLEEAKKTSSGTNIDLGEKKASNKELELFKTSKGLNKDLIEVNENISEKSEIINVISNFQPVGHEIKAIEKTQTLHFFILGGVIVVLLLLFLKLNKYLTNYKK